MHGRTLTSLLSAWAIAAGLAAGDSRQDEGGYWALWDDGREVTGEYVRDWYEREGKASLSGRRLFEPGSHVRLLCHTTRRPGEGGPSVFLINGDVLTGRVVGSLPGDPGENLPARLSVALAPPLLAGRGERSAERKWQAGVVEIRADAVARVVFGQHRPRPYRGGAVFFSDGRSLAVSSVRWAPDGFRALSEEEIVSGRFSELGEIHLPKVDVTEAVLSDAIVPSPDPSNWIGRMQTEEGSVLTYRVAMRESRGQRGRGSYDTHHAVQPLWSLTPIRVPESSICLRSYRRSDEVPLSLLPAEAMVERSFTGFVWPWQRNRTVRGEVLRCGSYFSGLGIGTHSYSQVAFELPPGARSFSCYVGLDRAVGAGGCARCEIRRDSASGKLLWRSGLLVGSKQPERVGPLAVDQAKRLVLVTDFAHDDRPPDADPGDIRDEVNWLLPLVTVDPSVLAISPADLVRFVPALAGWSVPDGALGTLKLLMPPDGPQLGRMAMEIGPNPLVLSRKLRVSLASAVLDISAVRVHHQSGHGIEVLMEGQPLRGLLDGGQPVQTRAHGPDTPVRQRWSLMPYLGREVTIALRVTRDKDWHDGQALVWTNLAFVPLIANLPADGKVPTPDVPLTQLEPAGVIWFPQDKGKQPQKTQLPPPSLEKVHGLSLANAYRITTGMRMTYELKPSFRQFVAVVGTENPYLKGPFTVLLDGKEVWRSSGELEDGRLEQVVVDIPVGAKALSLVPEHIMTSGVWAQAGFMR